MNDEDRIFELEKMVLDQARDQIALELVVKALIATHPDPTTLYSALGILKENYLHSAIDTAFDLQKSPDATESFNSEIEKKINKWQEILQPR